MQTFAKLLREHMTSAGMSGYELAKKSGVSHPEIYRLLAGARQPSFEIACKLAKGLGIAIGELEPRETEGDER